jgi:hypothetical protein
MKMLVDLFERLVKEEDLDPSLIESYTILLSFFANLNSNLDKLLLNHLTEMSKNEEEDSFNKFNHQASRKLGIILLSNNMPRSSSFFFYKPKKEAKKIKFLNYFDCCKNLASIKVNRRTIDTHKALKKGKIIF